MSSFASPGFIDSGGQGIPADLLDDPSFKWLQSFYNRRLEPVCSVTGEVMFVSSGDILMDWTKPNAA